MTTAATTEGIEVLVHLYCGQSDAKTQHIFREHLQLLVELGKAEQRQETAMDTYSDRSSARGVIH